jgi:hypothetical protein
MRDKLRGKLTILKLFCLEGWGMLSVREGGYSSKVKNNQYQAGEGNCGRKSSLQ